MSKIAEDISKERDDKIMLGKNLENVRKEAVTTVTFNEPISIDLASQGIDKESAEVLRGNLVTFEEDWNSPEMSVYDNYEQAKPETTS